MVTCSGVDVYTAIAGATGALYGPLHGGANEVSPSCLHSSGPQQVIGSGIYARTLHWPVPQCEKSCRTRDERAKACGEASPGYSTVGAVCWLNVQAVLKMLSEIGSVDRIPEFIEGVKNRKRKMSGFGHRVYKNYDPRAKVRTSRHTGSLILFL